MINNSDVCLSALTSIFGFGGILYSKIKKTCEQLSVSLEDFYFMSKEDICNYFPFIGAKFLSKFISIRNELFINVKHELIMLMEKNQVQLIMRESNKYPKKILQKLGDSSPPVLYIYGNINLFGHDTIGVVGSRKATPVGLEITKSLVIEKTNNNMVVVSGYASGIDYQAHLSALSNNGKTMFVIPYPLVDFNNKIFKEIQNKCDSFSIEQDNILIISEFLKSSLISRKSMPVIRNRLIAALSDEIFVIEAGKNSGTVNTGLVSMKMGTPVNIVDFPHHENSVEYEGNRFLLKMGGNRINYFPNLKMLYKKNVM